MLLTSPSAQARLSSAHGSQLISTISRQASLLSFFFNVHSSALPVAAASTPLLALGLHGSFHAILSTSSQFLHACMSSATLPCRERPFVASQIQSSPARSHPTSLRSVSSYCRHLNCLCHMLQPPFLPASRQLLSAFFLPSPLLPPLLTVGHARRPLLLLLLSVTAIVTPPAATSSSFGSFIFTARLVVTVAATIFSFWLPEVSPLCRCTHHRRLLFSSTPPPAHQLPRLPMQS